MSEQPTTPPSEPQSDGAATPEAETQTPDASDQDAVTTGATPSESMPSAADSSDQETEPEVATPVEATVVSGATGRSAGSTVTPATPDWQAKGQALLKVLQGYWATAKPILQEKSVVALLAANRFTNHFAEQVWPPLSEKAIAAVPAGVKAKVETQKNKLQPTLNKLRPIWVKVIVPFWQNVVQPLWQKGLAWVRGRLPENLAREFTDRFMTVAAITVFAVVYWFFSSLTAGPPVQAKQPTPQPKPTPVVQRPAPQPPGRGVNQPLAKPAPGLGTPKPSPVAAPKVTTAPPVAKPVAKPAPQPALDPVEVQAELEAAAVGIAPDLIDTVQAPLALTKLQVKLQPTWYDLSPTQQDSLGQKLWARAQARNFGRLELQDEAGELVARSPVVGDSIVVLKRQAIAPNL